MSTVETIKKNVQLLAQDEAFKGCIAASYRAGATEADQIVANGIAMIAWGLAVAGQRGDHGTDLGALRNQAAQLVAELDPVRLKEAA